MTRMLFRASHHFALCPERDEPPPAAVLRTETEARGRRGEARMRTRRKRGANLVPRFVPPTHRLYPPCRFGLRRKLLNFREYDGGHARNRTGVRGFAVRCVTTPPRGPLFMWYHDRRHMESGFALRFCPPGQAAGILLGQCYEICFGE